jgi:hypothetical protein
MERFARFQPGARAKPGGRARQQAILERAELLPRRDPVVQSAPPEGSPWLVGLGLRWRFQAAFSAASANS